MSLYNYLHAISPVWLDPTSMIKSWNTGIPHQIFQKKTKIETGTFTHAKTARSAPSKLWERSNWKSKPKRTKIEKSTSDFQKFQNFVQKRESCQNLNPKLRLSAEISFFKHQSTVLPIIFSQFWTWTKKVGRAPRIFFWEFEFLVFFPSKVCVGAYRKKMIQRDSHQFWYREMSI